MKSLIKSAPHKQYQLSFIVLIVVSLFTATFLRISLIVIYPLVVLFLMYFYRLRITPSFLLLLFIAGAGLLISFFSGFFIKYKLLSLFYMLPFLALLFSQPAAQKRQSVLDVDILLKCLVPFAVLNNIIGIIQVIINPYSDDSFTGMYSEFSVSLNGLSLLNAILFFYFFVQYVYLRKTTYLFYAVFFISCSILGYYGAGLMVCIAAIILSFFRFELKPMIKTALAALASVAVIYFLMLAVKPLALEYNIANIEKIIHSNTTDGPRKLMAFRNYAISYPKNIKDFLLGSGPGTFNSRSAFMVGSPSYFNTAFIKDPDQPYYFKNYAYTLWNDTNTVKELFMDGFRNQPFSSILAFLGEYGLLFTVLFFFLYYRYYRQVANLYYLTKAYKPAATYFRFFKTLIILLPLLLLIDNYFEYPEIMLLILLGIKFSHSALLTIQTNIVYER